MFIIVPLITFININSFGSNTRLLRKRLNDKNVRDCLLLAEGVETRNLKLKF